MSEQKHTPGPWRIDRWDLISGQTVIHITSPASKVAVIDVATGPGATLQLDRAEADAHLIAAAPELLAACRPVLAEAKGRADYMHDTWNPDAHVELTLTIAELRAIHASIAKAEGGKR